MRIVLDPEAVDDLRGIYQWIARDNPAAARAVIERLLDSIEHLGVFSEDGTHGSG